jgi:hypothetical protein
MICFTLTCYILYAKDKSIEEKKLRCFHNIPDLINKKILFVGVVFGINVATLKDRALYYGCASLQKGAETMHREPLNQELVNVFNFMIIPIVMAIVFFLVVHPFSNASSSSISFGYLFACLFCP